MSENKIKLDLDAEAKGIYTSNIKQREEELYREDSV